MRTRIACYFDVPRDDNQADYANYVDVRPAPHRTQIHLKAKYETSVFLFGAERECRARGSESDGRIQRAPPRFPPDVMVTRPNFTCWAPVAVRARQCKR